MEGAERRKLERFDLQIPAKLTVGSGGKEKKVFTLPTSNISSSGAFFRTDLPLPAGTEVFIELLLLADMFQSVRPGDHARITLAGTVLRVGRRGMAVRFDDKYRIRPEPRKPDGQGGPDSGGLL